MQLNFLKKAAVLSLGLVSLVSCGSTYSETDFATFKEKATEALKSETTYSSCKVALKKKATTNGKTTEENSEIDYTIDGRKFVAKADAKAEALLFADIINVYTLDTLIKIDLSNNNTYKFYTGAAFKCERTVETSFSALGVKYEQKIVDAIEYDNDGFVKSFKETSEEKGTSTSTSATTTNSGEETVTFTYTK